MSHPGYDVQTTTNVNPFNLDFSKAVTPKAGEEDFTIKPHLIYGQDELL